MPFADPEIVTTQWPDSVSDVSQQPVARLICARLSQVDGPVFDAMLRIRDRTVPHICSDGLRVALLHMSGWFVEWSEGPASGIRTLLDRVSRERRHQGLQVLHHSMGQPRLFQPWIGAIVQSDEGPTAFARRLFALQDRQLRSTEPEPATVWMRLCAPPAADMPFSTLGFSRATVLSAKGAHGFDFLQSLAAQERRTLCRRRFAGSSDAARDVASDYLDLPDVGPAGWRLVANARKGLTLGMAHAFLPDHAAVVLLLCDDPWRNRKLLEGVLVACRQVHHAPVIVGLGAHGHVEPELQELVERQGLTWLTACSPQQHPDAVDLWTALRPVLLQIG